MEQSFPRLSGSQLLRGGESAGVLGAAQGGGEGGDLPAKSGESELVSGCLMCVCVCMCYTKNIHYSNYPAFFIIPY